jgi:hypothetical protein
VEGSSKGLVKKVRRKEIRERKSEKEKRVNMDNFRE